MKLKASLICLLVISNLVTRSQNVGIGTTTPDASSKLQVSSPNKGILIPMIPLDSVKDVTHVPSPATGLIIFNTVDTTYNLPVFPYTYIKLIRGLYFWSGTQWQPAGSADEIWQRYGYPGYPGTIVPKLSKDEVHVEDFTGTNFYLANRKFSMIAPGNYGGTPIWTQNLDSLTLYSTALSAHVHDNTVSYYFGGGSGYAVEGFGESKRAGGGYFYSDSAIGIRSWSPGNTGGYISSTRGKGLVVSTQDSSSVFGIYPYGNNNSIGLDLMANSTINNPNLMIRENDNDYARVTFKNNTGANFWTLAGYNTSIQGNEAFNIYNSRYGDMLRFNGDGHLRIIGKDLSGSPILFNSGKLAISHLSSGADAHIGLLELDSNSYARQTFKTNTIRNDNFWNLSASSNNVLDPERFYIYNSRQGNILGIAGNGTVAVNKDPTYSAANDATFQVKASSSRDIFRLETNGSATNWSWWIDGSNNMEYYFNGVFKGSWSSSTGAYTASDRRLKKNIVAVENVLPSVLQLQPVSYQMKDDTLLQRRELGFIAQDVEPLFPQLVNDMEQRENKPSIKAINYSGFGVLAIKAIQEQQKIIDHQQLQINKLSLELQEIKNLLSANKK